jgi:hypothetical protein
MPSDGPPWIAGQNCSLTLAHPQVNAGAARGFYVKPDSYRLILPKVWYRGTNVAGLIPATPLGAGKHVLELVALCRDGLIHSDGTPSQLTAEQWHTALVAYTAPLEGPVSLVDPSGINWSVAVEEMEDRLTSAGGRFALSWETRLVLVEV